MAAETSQSCQHQEPPEEEKEGAVYQYQSPHVDKGVIESDVSEWCSRMRRLLEMEQQEEQQQAALGIQKYGVQQLEQAGVAINKLELASVETGMFGRVVATLRRRTTGGGNGADQSSLPPNKFTTGDIVGLSLVNSKRLARTGEPDLSGVVTKINSSSICLALDEGEDTPKNGGSSGNKKNEEDESRLTLEALLSTNGLPSGNDGEEPAFRTDILANDATYARLKAALKSLEDGNYSGAQQIVRLMFGPTNSVSFDKTIDDDSRATHSPKDTADSIERIKKFRPNDELNDSQESALMKALGSPSLFMIHGPPGTGKTTTVVEFIRRATALGNRVLACAPSNVAVDNLVERLGCYKKKDDFNLVRLGHPARVSETCWQYTLEAQMEVSESKSILQDVKKDLEEVLKKMRAGKRHSSTEWSELRDERRSLRKEFRQREKRVFKDVIKSSNVVLSTLAGAGSSTLLKALTPAEDTSNGQRTEGQPELFDIVVIDEVAQATELACWIPLLLGKKCVVAGDHLQLPPTIKCSRAEGEGLGVTLADRLVARLEKYGDQYCSMLSIQYRMHELINNWSSAVFYHNKLSPALSVREHVLSSIRCDAPKYHFDRQFLDRYTIPLSANELDHPIRYIDTCGCGPDYEEVMDSEVSASHQPSFASESKANRGEVDMVLRYVVTLLRHGIDANNIGVVTPYNAQRRLIKDKFAQNNIDVSVSSVDGFQGQEKEAIILSFVRSNKRGEIGFLKDYRRTNVAVTRAKRHLCIIGDNDTLGADKFYAFFLSYCEQRGDYRSAQEFLVLETPRSNISDNAIPKEAGHSTATGPKTVEIIPADIPASNNREPSCSPVRSMMSKQSPVNNSRRPTKAQPNNSVPRRQYHFPAMQHAMKLLVSGHSRALQRALEKYSVNLAEAVERSPHTNMSIYTVTSTSPLWTVQQVLNTMHKNLKHTIIQSSNENVSSEEMHRVCDKVMRAQPEVVVVQFMEMAAEFVPALRYEGLDALLRKHIYDAAKSTEHFCFKETLSASKKNVIVCLRGRQETMSFALESNSGSMFHFGISDTSDEDEVEQQSDSGKSTTESKNGHNVTQSSQNALLKQLAEERKSRSEQAKPKHTSKTSVDPQWLPQEFVETPSRTTNQKEKKKNTKSQSAKIDKGNISEKDVVGLNDITISKEQVAAFDGDEELAYLDSLSRQNQKKCYYKGCNATTSTVSTVCSYCHLKFCIRHGLPESHGCGDSARSAAKSAAEHGHNSRGSAMDARRRQAASKELRKKISEAEDQRVPSRKNTDNQRKNKKRGGKKK